MTRMARYIGLGAAALMLLSCGGAVTTPVGAPRTPEEVGACLLDADRTGGLAALLDRSSGWFSPASYEVVERGPEDSVARVKPGKVYAGDVPESVRLTLLTTTSDHIAREFASENELLLGLSYAVDGTPLYSAAVSLRGEDAVFIADCGFAFTEATRKQAAAERRTPASLINAVVRGQDARAKTALSQAERPMPPTPWSQRPVDNRQIDESETPPSVLQTLDQVELHLDVPDVWKTFAARLCPKVPSVGWSTCANFGAEDPRTGRLDFFSYTRGGEPLEVWLIDDREGIRKPYVRLLTIQQPKSVSNVVFVGDGSISTREELIEAARARDVFAERRM